MKKTNVLDFENLIEVLQFRAGTDTSHSTAFTHIENFDDDKTSISFASLDAEARAIAAFIQLHTAPGDRVLLVYPPGIDYITTFFGCAYAGVIAVPALPPANRKTFPRLQGIIDDAMPKLVLTLARFGDRMQEIQAKDASLQASYKLVLSDCLDPTAMQWQKPVVRPDDVVFLQYTSGSTSQPKGVMVTHRNILANLNFLSLTFPLEINETIVSWLPPHHDMGLISKILYPVFAGVRCVQFAPAAFLMRPYRWLKAISDYKARFTAAPNFAFALCVKRITQQEKATLDLSCMRYALNGAEPIRPRTLQEFSAAFHDCGWNAGTVVPGYGLAEATLLVSARTATAQGVTTAVANISKTALAANLVREPFDAKDQLVVVSVGHAEPVHHEIMIVDPVLGQRCAVDDVGEIWVRGPSVAKGYWNRPELNEDIFHAKVEGGSSNYLRTGDAGFLRDGELYVTGRLKEMMIFEGNNIYPQDVERNIETLSPGFRANGCAVFALEHNEDSKLVVVQEVESRSTVDFDGIEVAIAEKLLEQHGITAIHAVLLVKPGHVPRTSSGKIQRLLCREWFLQKKFDTIWKWQAGAENATGMVAMPAASEATYSSLHDVEAQIKNVLLKVIGIEISDPSTNLFNAGISSIDALRITNEIRKLTSVSIHVSELFANPSITQMAYVLLHKFSSSPLQVEEGEV